MRIQNKLFLASLIGSSLLIGAMLALMQWSVDRGMLDYVNTQQTEHMQPVAQALEDFYLQQQSWQPLIDKPRQFQHIVRTAFDDDRANLLSRPHISHRRGRAPIPLVLKDASQNLIIGPNRHKNYASITLSANNNTIGYLLYPKLDRITEGFELSFVEQQQQTFMIISAAVLLFAALFSLPLSRHVVTPIKHLAATTRKLTQGDYQQLSSTQAATQRQDELGELTRDFNQLSKTLEENETLRQRWLADTSHELRTPIAILQGEIEAMLDEVRPISKDNLQSIHQEVKHLAKLVEDLQQLSNADIGATRYRMESADLGNLLTLCCKQHQALYQDKNISLQCCVNAKNTTTWGDPKRLQQMIDNLLNNSVKYTDTDGQVFARLDENDEQLLLTIEDSAPSVPDSALAQLFDHLYRVDSSRNRESGGSGLGLAICKRIAEAHGGTINANHSALGGLSITLHLQKLIE